MPFSWNFHYSYSTCSVFLCFSKLRCLGLGEPTTFEICTLQRAPTPLSFNIKWSQVTGLSKGLSAPGSQGRAKPSLEKLSLLRNCSKCVQITAPDPLVVKALHGKPLPSMKVSGCDLTQQCIQNRETTQGVADKRLV